MRTVDAARLGLGLALLVRPELPQDALATRTWGQGSGLITDSVARRVIQALGARYVVQGLAGAILRWRWVPAADATVDLVHAASMLAVAHVVPEHRRLATTSAAVAFLFAIADRLPRSPTERWTERGTDPVPIGPQEFEMYDSANASSCSRASQRP